MSKVKTKSQNSKVFKKKVFEFFELDELMRELKNVGEWVVLVGGCFDILHIGHVRFLKKAKSLGDVLIVALESDEKTKLLKGEGRPINSQEVRAEILASLEVVDYVLKLGNALTDRDYLELTKKISPKILAVTQENEKIKKIAEDLGIQYVKVMPLLRDISTSKLALALGIE